MKEKFAKLEFWCLCCKNCGGSFAEGHMLALSLIYVPYQGSA
jgi:hypothetical protein